MPDPFRHDIFYILLAEVITSPERTWVGIRTLRASILGPEGIFVSTVTSDEETNPTGARRLSLDQMTMFEGWLPSVASESTALSGYTLSKAMWC